MQLQPVLAWSFYLKILVLRMGLFQAAVAFLAWVVLACTTYPVHVLHTSYMYYTPTLNCVLSAFQPSRNSSTEWYRRRNGIVSQYRILAWLKRAGAQHSSKTQFTQHCQVSMCHVDRRQEENGRNEMCLPYPFHRLLVYRILCGCWLMLACCKSRASDDFVRTSSQANVMCARIF